MKKYFSSLRSLWIIPVALTTSFGVFAQTIGDQKTNANQVTDAQAIVPAVTYRSVFKETSLGVEKDTDNWRKANNEVGKFLRGHVDILKWEEQENAKAMKEPMSKSMQEPMAAPSTPQKPATAPASTDPVKPDATKPIAAPAHKH